ncbi:putative hydroxyacyl glutathione hydrolase [Ramicandelaber brevisporus]|nr:putative hydroxyacyl glutathione hydrolase [Ramicandelaber brevisporus]
MHSVAAALLRGPSRFRFPARVCASSLQISSSFRNITRVATNFTTTSPTSFAAARYFSTTIPRPEMRVVTLPIFQDNYSYVIFDDATKKAAVVDPAEASKVLPQLKTLVTDQGYELTHVLTTHHHADHAGGNEAVADAYPGIAVVGADKRVNAITALVNDGAEFKIGGVNVKSLLTVGHTTGHVSFYATPAEQNSVPAAVFTGDCLFLGGCGRFFEGTPEDMYKSLIEILGKLPKDTKVYCGHEYTRGNYKFALSVDGQNADLIKLNEAANATEITVPGTIENELKANPFMRVHEPALQASTGKTDPIDVMAKLRELKNNFRG